MPLEWTIPLIAGDELSIEITAGSQMFIVGPNGSGKSALIQHAVNSLGADNVRRISAHRQTWLESGNIDMTPQIRRQFDEQLRGQEPQQTYRWREWNSQGRVASVLFDLAAADNDLARRIRDHAYGKDQKAVDKIVDLEQPVFAKVNELLTLSNLAVTVENSAGEEILARHRDSSTSYSIAQMSDGERNAVIIAANVLTVKSGTVLLIDEPERHLHRSIIEPFLTALFAKRPDCPFIVSTHEIGLPIANPEAPVLTVRSCQWDGVTPSAWDANLLEGNSVLPEDLKRAILGARKRILFVEGKPQSLDFPLYSVLFPTISVTPAGSCEDVIKAVRGLRDSQELHDITAIGLIDRDNRCDTEVSNLEQTGIYALTTYSVESLYYCEGAMEAVSNWQEKSLGHDAKTLLTEARAKALKGLSEGGLAERLSARRCERTVRDRLMSRIPGWVDIRDNPEQTIAITAESSYQDELSCFYKLLTEERIEEIIARYPIRETPILTEIAGSFELTKKNYEKTLLARVVDDAALAEELRQRLKPLSGVLMGEP